MKKLLLVLWENMVLKMFKYKGRASRKEYFICSVFAWLILSAWFICSNEFGQSPTIANYTKCMIVAMVWLFIQFVPLTALRVRRMHDIGKSGWNLLWPYAIIVGSFIAPDVMPASFVVFLWLYRPLIIFLGYIFLLMYMYDKTKE